MGEVKIVRNDRGIDFRRIEQIIKMFQRKVSKKLSEISRAQNNETTERKKLLYDHFGLTAEVDAINSIDKQIKELEADRRVHENKIRDITQGTNKNDRYNSYDTIRDDSPADKFIKENNSENDQRERELRRLMNAIEEPLWLAKDIDQAVAVYEDFCSLINKKITEVTTND